MTAAAEFPQPRRPRDGRALTARHVGVAPSIVNNNPETTERSRRSFPTAGGWFFARARMLDRGALLSRAQRSTKWCVADPGPFQSVAVPDQRCTAPRCTASGTRDSVGRVRSLIHFSNSPSRSRGAFLRPGFATLLHSPRIEGWAERRETFGCVRGTREAYHDAIRQAPSEAPCVP